MGNFNFGKYKILTSATNIDATGKTLIISTHGALTGTSFERPYPTVVQFCTPKMTSLRAALDEVIAGRVTASDLASSSQKTVDDYSLTWFEGDPNDNSIVASLGGTKMDVLVMKSGYTEALSSVLQFLNNFGYKYPSILCVFCRVSAAQFLGGTYVGGSTLGAVHQTVSQVNRHKVNATALALELQQKKGFK
jgi:hypothetical protein